MNNKIPAILVPALTGKFGDWRYYQLILKVEDFARNVGSKEHPQFRIKSVDEVEEIYSEKGIGYLLQRTYDIKRLKPIKNYILKQSDRYLNNLTVGIFGGSPDWLNVEIKSDNHADFDLESISKQLGFIKLDGSESIFVLDGQHRLKGLRAAYAENPEKIAKEEVVCTLIIHRDSKEGRVRTRRMFSTINRHAKPVSMGENILLDEDDVSSIVVRSLVEEYRIFKNKKVVALVKGGNISKGILEYFTTVVTLWTINEKIICHAEMYPEVEGKLVRVRPSDTKINEQKQRVFSYWNLFFKIYPDALKFINDNLENRKNYRNSGGPFYLRPIAQIAIFEILTSFETLEDEIILRLKKIPIQLEDVFWHYILWNPHKSTMNSNRSIARNYIRYQIGAELKPKELENLSIAFKKIQET